MQARRKHLVKEYEDSYPIPKEGEEIGLCVGLRGERMFDIETASGEKLIAFLPTRFQNLIWLRQGMYVVFRRAEGAEEAEKVRGWIEGIYLVDKVKEAMKEPFWPEVFREKENKIREVEGEEEEEEDENEENEEVNSYSGDDEDDVYGM